MAIISKESIQPMLWAFSIWIMSMILLIIAPVEGEVTLAWGVLSFTAILLYWYSIEHLIPKAIGKKHPFLSFIKSVSLLLLVTFLPITFCLFIYTNDFDAALQFSSWNILFQMLITTTLSWIISQQQAKGRKDVSNLKKELGQTNAHFDFLRSQINPHFLFNAMNTVYSTALQEDAKLTSEAIQKLGDMMRFMLQENMQDRIQLSKEIEYLENYIAFQRLRIKRSPKITIEVSIEQNAEYEIAPMLLIPFVENAFKHGISMQEFSFISINLFIIGDVIHFYVLNSKHHIRQIDTEKVNGGIGLENVKGRLELLYPGKYELLINDREDEFEVNLIMSL